ncbi:hypothetical protein PTSG_01274 [Salpingoeca rosetta]|uniref:Uncharacterized protein n=1 Tax=Salpingoeca rosetta (strain ATCC 50818 / BSB-021) TaxID=946362 RepID=F2TZV6_SALR5|nr:uncharacterized protein PTSG_01274 [Salpingoeca rosetta]EGD80684.1 hypothetical protein PTSG_01274 [Salpingoeca rosetta]|eukprot:XP_004997245.1 hypothetical protein PTSG_01274 [Salpingoeca rosetta]
MPTTTASSAMLSGDVETVLREARLLAKKCREFRACTSLGSPAAHRLLQMLSHTHTSSTPREHVASALARMGSPLSHEASTAATTATSTTTTTTTANGVSMPSFDSSPIPKPAHPAQTESPRTPSTTSVANPPHQHCQPQTPKSVSAHQQEDADSAPSPMHITGAETPRRPGAPSAEQEEALELLVWMASPRTKQDSDAEEGNGQDDAGRADTTADGGDMGSTPTTDSPARPTTTATSPMAASQDTAGTATDTTADADTIHISWPCTDVALAQRIGAFISRLFHLRYGPLTSAFPHMASTANAGRNTLSQGTFGADATVAAGQQTNEHTPVSLAQGNLQSLSSALSTIIDWLTTLPITDLSVTAMYIALKKAKGEASVRRHIVAIVLDWVAAQELGSVSGEGAEQAVEACLVLGLTDVWSAIRKAAALRVSDVLGVLTFEQTRQLFEALVSICSREDASWQETEGAVQGITTIIRKFTWVHKTALRDDGRAHGHGTFRFAAAADSLTDRSDYQLTFGEMVLPAGLPSFVVDGFNSIVYKLLAHEQLSIREYATKAYAAFLSRSQFHQALNTLENIVARLRRERGRRSFSNANSSSSNGSSGAPRSPSPSSSPSPLGTGVGSAAARARARVRARLSHPSPPRPRPRGTPSSDTVAPATSLPALHSLSPPPSPASPSSTMRTGWGAPITPLPAHEAEGLLGVCHFIIKHVPPGFLLPKWPLFFSTFSAYLAHPASTVRQATSTVFKFVVAKDSSNPVMLKLVLQGLAADWPVDVDRLASAAEATGAGDEGDGPGPSWQWKEGRLLAYELILRYCITNHVHYLFPTLLLGTPYKPRQGIEQTTDPHQSHIPKRKFRRLLSIPSTTSLLSRRGHVRSSSHHDPLPHLSFKSEGGNAHDHTPLAAPGHVSFHSHMPHAHGAPGPVTPFGPTAVDRNARSTSHKPRVPRHRAVTGAPPMRLSALDSPTATREAKDDAASMKTPPRRSPHQGSADDYHVLLSPTHTSTTPPSARSVSSSPNTTRKEMRKQTQRLDVRREATHLLSPHTPTPAKRVHAVASSSPSAANTSTGSLRDLVSRGVRTPGRRMTARKTLLRDQAVNMSSTPLKFTTYQQIRVHRLTRTLSTTPGATLAHTGSLLSHLADLDLLDTDVAPPAAGPLCVRLARSPLWGISSRECRGAMVELTQQFQRASKPDILTFDDDDDDNDGDGDDGDDEDHDAEGSLTHQHATTAPSRDPTTTPTAATPTATGPSTHPLYKLQHGHAARAPAASTVRNPLAPQTAPEPSSPVPRRLSRSKSFSVGATPMALRVVGQVVDQTPHEGEMPAWADTSRFEPLSLVLLGMTLQVVESFSSQQFELQRMAKAVLPLLTEVMRWFDPTTLHDLWLAFNPTDVSWAAHVVALSFKQSVAHAAWLKSFVSTSALSASPTQNCQRACGQMISFVEPHVTWLSPLFVARACSVPRVDATMIVCLDICLLTCTSFRPQLPNVQAVELAVVSRLVRLGKRAYPNSGLLAKVARQLQSVCAKNKCDAVPKDDAQPDHIDRAAFLGHMASTRQVPDAVVFKLALKNTVEQLHAILSDFADVCSLEAAMSLLPILARTIPLVQADEDIVKNILEAIHRCIDRLGYAHWFAVDARGELKYERASPQHHSSRVTVIDVDTVIRCKTPSAQQPPADLQRVLFSLVAPSAFQHFLNVIQSEECDISLLRRVLDVVRTLFVATASTLHLKSYLQVLAEKLRKNQPAAPPPAQQPPHLDAVTGAASLDLSIHSDGDSDDEKSVAQSLEHSGRGFANASGATADDDESDWDSWEEEDQGDAAVVQVVCEYISHFKSIFTTSRMQARLEWYRQHLNAEAQDFEAVFRSLSLEDQITISRAVSDAASTADDVEIHASATANSDTQLQHSKSTQRLAASPNPRNARVSVV